MLSTRNDNNKKKRKRKIRIDGATPTIEEKDGCTMAVSIAPSLDMIDQLGYIPDILRQVMCVASLKDRDPLKPRGHGVMEDFFSKWDGMTGDMKACVSWKGVIKKYSKRVKSTDRAKSIKSPRFLINGKYISVYTIISKWFYIAPDYYEEAAGYRPSSSSSGMEMQSQPTRDLNFLNEENTLLEDCCSDGKGVTPEEDPLVFFHTPHPDPASPSAPPSYYTATLPSNPPPPFMLPGNKKYQRFKFFNHETDEVVTFWVSKQMVMTEEEPLPNNNNNNQDDVQSAAVTITTKRTTRAKYEIVDFQTRARKDIHIVEALVSASSCLDRHNHHSNNKKNVGNEFRFICINPFHVMHHARNKDG